MKLEGALLTRILNEGTKQDELRIIEKDEIDTLIFVLLSSIRGIRNEMSLTNSLMDIEPAVAQFIRIMMYGLRK
jgi:hypothetical protein